MSLFSPRSERISHPQRVKGVKPAQLSAKRQGLDVRWTGKHPQVDTKYSKPWFEVGNLPKVWIGKTGEVAQNLMVANDSRNSTIKTYNGALKNK